MRGCGWDVRGADWGDEKVGEVGRYSGGKLRRVKRVVGEWGVLKVGGMLVGREVDAVEKIGRLLGPVVERRCRIRVGI